MAKVNITKPVGGVESLPLVSAFKVEDNVYTVFDSEKNGSMGLPIIYVSKLSNNKLEKINDTNEWQSVKNYLKGIISGTNFQYVNIGNDLNADEAYYMPLTLPQASFDMIKSRYVVNDDKGTTAEEVLMPDNNGVEEAKPEVFNETVMPAAPEVVSTPETVLQPEVAVNSNVVNPMPVENNHIPAEAPKEVSTPNAVESPAPAVNMMPPEPVAESVMPTAPVAPVMPNNNVTSNVSMSSAPMEVAPIPTNNVATASVTTEVENNDNSEFDSDRETFLKACENMFDAVISKYQKQLLEYKKREEELKRKEAEIEQKLKNASEHLANAEAREQVANIAHDNAQRVMDLNNFMPQAPDNNQTGVI